MKKTLWKILSQKSASFYLALMVAVGVSSSCGKRTTSYSRTEIKTDTLQYNRQIELRQNSTLFDVFSLYPIDNTKPIIYNGISYYNSSIRFDKSKFENLEIVANENLSQGSVSSESKEKETEKTDYSNVYIGLFFVFVGGVLLFFRYIYLHLVKAKVQSLS